MNNQARLVVEGRGNWVYTHPIGEAEKILIGRGGECDIRLQDLHSSSRHAEIVRDQDGFIIRDLGSRNGTFLNNKKITEGPLKNGYQIKIGITTMSFLTGEDESFYAPSGSMRGADSSVAPAPESALQPMMDRLDGLRDQIGKSKAKDGGDILAAALEDLQRELRDAKATIRRMTVVNEFARLIAAEPTQLQMLGCALGFMASQTGGENGFIMQVDPQKQKWVVRARFGSIEDWAMRSEGEEKGELPMSLTLVEKAIRSGEPIVSNCAKEDPRFDESKSIVNLGILSCLCFPIRQEGNSVGVAYVDRRINHEPFSDEEQKLFAALTAQLGQMLYPPAS